MVQCGARGWNHCSWQGHLHSAEGKRLSRKQLTPGVSRLADSGQYEPSRPCACKSLRCSSWSSTRLLQMECSVILSTSFLLGPSTQSQTGINGSASFSVFSWGEQVTSKFLFLCSLEARGYIDVTGLLIAASAKNSQMVGTPVQALETGRPIHVC